MHHIIVQHAATGAFVPDDSLLQSWANTALKNITQPAEVTLRIVSIDEMSALNMEYRHKKGATNVLSFPFDMPDGVVMEANILGDIVICADVVNNEAEEQKKTPDSHWAHMIIHGMFHLLGYDHETDGQAEIMEALEVKVLRGLGFPNPYAAGENIKHYD